MNPATTIPRLTVFVVCGIFVFSSCIDPSLLQQPVTIPESRQKQNYFYTPTSHNTPLLTDKNDLSGSIQHAFGSRHKGVEIQAAYLPAKHFGMTASYSSGGHDGEIFKYHRISAGAGYVRRFNEYWNFETYAGYTYASINNLHSTGSSSIKIPGFYVQPAFFYYDRKKNVQVAFITKLAGSQFTIINSTFSGSEEPYTNNQFGLLRQHPFQVFLEPGIVFRFGWKNFLFHTGFSYAHNITNDGLHYPGENFTIGVVTKLNTAKKTH